MRTVRVTDVLSESRLFAQRHELRLPRAGDTFSLDAELGYGTFGEVWSTQVVKGRSGKSAVAVKVVKEPHSLVDAVTALQRALERNAGPEWPDRLLAVPFSIVTAELDGEPREVIFMLDLVALGYENAKPFFEKPQDQAYRERPVHERIELAYSYARGAALLEAIGFIHGDQNIPNLMLNPETLDAQILDFDAGAVLVTGRERAKAKGKEDDCIPPEAKVPTPEGFDVDTSRWDAVAERWSVGTLVGYLALGLSPAFFLPRINARIVDAYAEEGPWPEVDPSSKQLGPGKEAVYEYWLPHLEAAPGRIVETFGRFFRAGTRGDDRPTAEDWIDALDAARQKPTFKSLEVAPLVAPEGAEVVITWEAEGAERVESAVLGDLPAKGEAHIAADKTTRHTLTAINFYGRVEKSTEVVRVVPLPRLTTIPMAGFPGLELRTRIATAAPARPAALAPARLARAVAIPPTAPLPLRPPTPLPAPPHFGALFKPTSVSRRIRTMMRKVPTE
jgi:Protein tyrosine and serine/threonine kinase